MCKQHSFTYTTQIAFPTFIRTPNTNLKMWVLLEEISYFVWTAVQRFAINNQRHWNSFILQDAEKKLEYIKMNDLQVRTALV